MTRENSLRGRVIRRWENTGKPNWDVHQTLRICVEMDDKLKAAGLEPAPKFRKAVKMGNEKYLITWTLGCHFQWLNPRLK